MTRFAAWPEVVETFRGKSVAIVGSGPGSAENEPGVIDGHDVVLRVSNYKTGAAQGVRCDVHYSFYGSSIKTTAKQLLADGCKLLMCKLPNSRPIPEELCWWHLKNAKHHGINYRYIYELRAKWWPAPVFVPDDARFRAKFNLLSQHQPTTGFAAILDVLECEPREVLLTGFDFFESGLHNVDEKWRPGDPTDPICHRPDLERAWIKEHAGTYPLKFDKRLAALLA